MRRRSLPWACSALALLGVTLGGGCGATFDQVGGSLLAANAAAIPVFHRDLFDILVSGLTGKDCSVVRLDRSLSYCKPDEGPPAAPVYCTRSIGDVDCWASTENLGIPPPRGVAEGPSVLTPLQEQNRTARWPGLF